MDIILVTSSFNDEVHGTDDEKKTGCGIILTKPENASRFTKGGKMTDLKEITCEKCKEKLAKKIIRADKKEMAKLLKEERARAKKGIEDEGIIPLGNTTAKITKTEEQKRQEEEERLAAAKREAEEAARAAEEAAAKAAAEEAERKRAAEEAERAEREAREAAEKAKANEKIALDDDLAEFAIDVPKKPESEPDLQDDFLAQFAIQKPEEDTVPGKEPMIQDDFLAQFAIPVPKQDDEPEEIEEPEEMDDISFEDINVQPAAEEIYSEETENKPEVVTESEDDVMKMFSIEPSSEQNEVSGGSESVSRYENDSSVIDIAENEISAVEPEEQEQLDLSGISEWDDVVNRIFGVQTEVSENEESHESIPAEMEEISLPKIDDIPVPEPEEIAEPVIEEIADPEPEELNEPVIEEIAAPKPVENVQISQTAPINTVPVQPTPAAPAPAPVVQPAAPAQNSAQPQIISVPQFAGYDMNGQPVYTYVQMQMTGLDANGQPVFVPINGQPPIMSAPQINPAVQPSVPVQPAAPVQPAPAPVPPAPVKQPAFKAANNGTYTPPTANISKIAVNPHSKSTSQAFVNAIASSKDYANKNLIETQGLRANSPILTSVEDVLSQMGDDSLAKKKAAEQKNVVPVNEYKGPVKSAPKASSSVQKTEPAKDDIRFMSKADLKAKKKQDKIDAKFKKDMAKRGF